MRNSKMKNSNRLASIKILTGLFLLPMASSFVFAKDSNLNRVESFRASIASKGRIESKTINSEKISLEKSDASATISRRNPIDTKTLSRTLSTVDNKQLVYRDESPQKSTNIDGFSFYSANAYLNYDLDGDGYFSDFTIAFDADYDFGYADVYAVLYYSKNGGPWIEYFETDSFEIHLDDANDEYQVTSTLENDFPTSEYDILVDLYQLGVSGIVATISSDDTNNLFALPLEDEAHELTSNASEITYVASTISHDADSDSFYTDLTLEYDISTAYTGDLVYAEVILTNSDELWSQTLLTDNFELGNQTEFIDLVLNAGYTAGWYDVQINLINYFTGEVIANAAQDFVSLASLKLESVDNDDHFDSPAISSGGINSGADSYESGGGAISGYFYFLFLLILLYVRDMKAQKEKLVQLKLKGNK